MALEAMGRPLRLREMTVPTPGPDQVLLKVRACGVCRTDLHIIDGDLPAPGLRRILGHQIVGTVANGRRRGRLRHTGTRGPST